MPSFNTDRPPASLPGTSNQAADGPLPNWVSIVTENVNSLRFGFVQITVHDSNVVQIEKTERFRLEPPRRQSKPSTLGRP